jgi:hypothetical protein
MGDAGDDPSGEPRSRENVLQLYRRDAHDRAAADPQWLRPLRGHDLACWCALDQPCHADILLELLEAFA